MILGGVTLLMSILQVCRASLWSKEILLMLIQQTFLAMWQVIHAKSQLNEGFSVRSESRWSSGHLAARYSFETGQKFLVNNLIEIWTCCTVSKQRDQACMWRRRRERACLALLAPSSCFSRRWRSAYYFRPHPLYVHRYAVLMVLSPL